MLKGSDVIGIPIRLLDSAEATGERVQNWILDTDMHEVLGFLVAQGGWAGSARVLLWENIESITPQHMVTACRTPIIEIGQVMKVKHALENQQTIIGLHIVTRSNENLGQIVDLYFDETDGTVRGFATVDGRYANNGFSSIFIPVSRTFEQVHNMLLVENAVVQQIRPASDDRSDGATGYSIEDARGRRSDRAVRSDEGTIIVATGQIVTDDIIRAARQADRADELLDAVGLSA